MSLSQWFNDCAKGAKGFGRNLRMQFDLDGSHAKRTLGRAKEIINIDARGESLLNFTTRSLVRISFAPFMKAVGSQGADKWTKRPMILLNPAQDDINRASTLLHECRHAQQERMEGRIRPDFRTLREAIIFNRLIEGDAGAASNIIMEDIIDKKHSLNRPVLPLHERMERAFFTRLRDDLDSYDREMVLHYYHNFLNPPADSMPRLDLSRSRKMLIAGVEVHDPKYMTGFSDQALEREILRTVEKDVLAVVAAIDGYRENCANMTPDVDSARKKEIKQMVVDMVVRGQVIDCLERKGWANPYKPPAPDMVS